jgi:hypothetical protein
LYLPLWVETPPSGLIYDWPWVGIQIERIETDGHVIPPTNDPSQWYTYNPKDLQVGTPFFVYVLELDAWNYEQSGDEERRPKYETDYGLQNLRTMTENNWDQVVYRIPYNARRIKIEYRLRYPVNGRNELGPLITVVADRSDLTVMDNE